MTKLTRREMRDACRDLGKLGLDVREIAKVLGVCVGTARVYANLPSNHGWLNRTNVRAIQQMAAQGVSLQQISEHLEIGITTVQRYLDYLDLEVKR